MSSVTQALMAEGSARIDLDPAAPRRIVEGIDQFSALVITSGRIANPDATELLTSARWVGRIQDRPGSTNTITAAGTAVWLGDTNHIGPTGHGNTVDGTTSAQDLVSDLFGVIDDKCGLYLGSYTSLPATPVWAAWDTGPTYNEPWETPRAFFDRMHDFFGWVWTVRGITFHIGEDYDDIFRTDEVLISTGLPFTDLSTRMVPGRVDVRRTDEDYAGAVTVADGTYAGVSYKGTYPKNARFATPTPYAQYKYVTGSDLGSNSGADDQADLELLRYPDDKKYVSIAADLDDPGAHIEPGDAVLVSAPEASLIDTTNEFDSPVGVLYPVSMRVVEMTWPVGRDMGVWIIQNTTAEVVDVSDLVEVAPGPVRISVGFPQPSISEVVNGRN